MRAPFVPAALAAALLVSGCMPGFPGASALDPAVAAADAKGATPPPVDELAAAQKQFRDRNFGLAEQAYQRIVEKNPRNADAWLGLGAAHDELGRFDLADKDYDQVARLTGPSVALLNDRAYSYMMRGDLRKARATFLRAQAMDPTNVYVSRNLEILDARAGAVPARAAL